MTKCKLFCLNANNARSCPHKVKSNEDLFFAPPKIGNHVWHLCMKFLYETERACLVEVNCLPYLLLVESSASPWNLDFRVFPKSLRYGDFNGVLQFFSSLLFMKKYNLKISPNFAICNIERFFGHRSDSSIKLTGRGNSFFHIGSAADKLATELVYKQV